MKQIFIVGFMATLLFETFSCTQQRANGNEYIPQTERACKSMGGEWGRSDPKTYIGIFGLTTSQDEFAQAFCKLKPKARKPILPHNENECRKKGYEWRTKGIPGSPKACNAKSTDEGAACSDAEQCEGICLARGVNSNGEVVVGRCSAYDYQAGCIDYLELGKKKSICSD